MLGSLGAGLLIVSPDLEPSNRGVSLISNYVSKRTGHNRLIQGLGNCHGTKAKSDSCWMRGYRRLGLLSSAQIYSSRHKRLNVSNDVRNLGCGRSSFTLDPFMPYPQAACRRSHHAF